MSKTDKIQKLQKAMARIDALMDQLREDMDTIRPAAEPQNLEPVKVNQNQVKETP